MFNLSRVKFADAYLTLLVQQEAILVDHAPKLANEVARRKLENLVRLGEILLAEHRLLEAVVANEALARVRLVPERSVNVRLNRTILVRIHLLLDSNNKEHQENYK